VVDFPVRVDRDIVVASLHVECGGHVVVDPQRSVSIRSTGNIEVCGTLEMRPASAEVQHLIRFEGIDESTFVGGGMRVVPTDVGLWVHGDGQLDLHGTPRLPWARATRSLAAGTRTIELAAQPLGWRVGDELVVTPTGSPVDARHYERFDEVTVQAITGATVTVSSPLRYAHPIVAVGDGHVLGSEVLNLTRNVRVEGTPSGRTHAMAMMVTRSSQIRFASFRHFGPRQGNSEGYTDFVLGRYGFHWHMAGDGSRGSIMDGVVMRDGGSHAFVTHLSNGVTHRNCVTYNTTETPYWWDGAPDTRTPAPPSHDVSYADCIAARVRCDPEFRGYRMAGFDLGHGTGNTAVGCVAVGVLGNVDASGFQWPEGAHGVWSFHDCIAHNNRRHGLFAWQNSDLLHVVQRFISYHNGAAGISHGAYANRYVYRDSILFGNAGSGLLVHAVSKEGARLTFQNLLIDAAGQTSAAVETVRHALAPGSPTLLLACRLKGYTGAGVMLRGPAEGSTHPDLLEVSGCRFGAQKFWVSRTVHPGTRITCVMAMRTLIIRPWTALLGRRRPVWGARVRTLEVTSRVTAPSPIALDIKPAAGL